MNTELIARLRKLSAENRAPRDAIDEAADALEAAQPKEQFCFCNEDISLQIVTGGAAPEGLYGSVTLKVSGEYVKYVRATAEQPAGSRWRGGTSCTAKLL